MSELSRWCERCERRVMGFFHACSRVHVAVNTAPVNTPLVNKDEGVGAAPDAVNKRKAYMREYMAKKRAAKAK